MTGIPLADIEALKERLYGGYGMADELMEDFLKGKYDQVGVVYAL
ncbi:MAG: hypothetical protein ACLUOS_19095 [Odoribacter splanchnicus]